MLKTWIEINTKAVAHNFKVIKSLLQPKTKLWAVVKSNAYGHGLTLFSALANQLGVDGFGVDSVVEGLKLRENGIKKPILVLGPTLPPNSLADAFKHKITLTISNWEALERLAKSRYKPGFHLKIDTGMHRQGFYFEDLKKAVKLITNYQLPITGVYTHFASAKDLNYPTFTDFQFHAFKKAVKILERAGCKNLIKHASATGGTLISQEYHLNAVRVGIGLYGLWPSKELEIQLRRPAWGRSPDPRASGLSRKIRLQPVLSWHSVVSEVKNIPKGDYIGYDLVERASKPTKIAIIPIGYWHGFDRGLSSIGEVLVGGKRARVLGRVSMDLIVVDVTGINCKTGAKATIIGRQGREEITAAEMAQKIGTAHYEIITRINPLIERVIS